MNKLFKDYPLEIVILLVLIYAIFVGGDFAGYSLMHRFVSLFLGYAILFILYLIKIAWKIDINTVKRLYIFKNTANKGFLGEIIYRVNTLFITFLVFLIIVPTEMLANIVITGNLPNAIGIPFYIYSFPKDVFLINGFVLNILFYYLVIGIVLKQVNTSK